MEETTDQIQNYLDDHDRLYREWIENFNTSSTPGLQPTSSGSKAPIEKIKAKFEEWLTWLDTWFQENVCPLWHKIQSSHPNAPAITVIKLLCVGFAALDWPTPINITATATILVAEGYLHSHCKSDS